MSIWVKRLFIAVFIAGLTSCDTVIDAPPYLVGTFVGTCQPDTPEGNDPNNPLSYPITIESRLVNTTPTRYNFEGTVSLNGEVYTMTGYEESSYSDLAYLQPQVRAVDGYYLMSLRNETGATYSVCGATHYGSAGYRVYPEDPHFYSSTIITGNLASWENCFYPEGDTIVGTIDELEKR